MPSSTVRATPDLKPPEEAAGSGSLPFLARYGRFLVVGLTGVVVNLIVFAVVLDLSSPTPASDLFRSLFRSSSFTSARTLDELLASVTAFAVATLWNFAWNNAWTFRSKVGHRYPTYRRLGLYYGVSLGSLAVNEVVLLGTLSLLLPLYGQALGILLGSVVGFVGNQRLTFAERTPGAE